MKISTIIKDNPNSGGAIFLAIISNLVMIFYPGIIGIIIWFFALSSLTKAYKRNENKKFIKIINIFLIITPLLFILNIVMFVVSNLQG